MFQTGKAETSQAEGKEDSVDAETAPSKSHNPFRVSEKVPVEYCKNKKDILCHCHVLKDTG